MGRPACTTPSWNVPAANAMSARLSADRPRGTGRARSKTIPAQKPTTAPRWGPPLNPAQAATTTKS